MRDGKPSDTAQYVALVRAVLHDKHEIDDPYAAPMLTPTMKVVHAVLRRAPRLTDSTFFTHLARRTIEFDRGLVAATQAGIDQVVSIAAGYDARPWRFAAPGVVFFEVDHPATQADKARRAPSPAPVYVACDLRVDSLADGLANAGFDRSRPSVFLIEGLTMYLSVADVAQLLAATAELAAPGSRLVVNFAVPVAAGSRQAPRTRVLAALGRLRGEPFGEAQNIVDPASLVSASGWGCDEVMSGIITASA